jgi:hypothetical protein
MALPAFVQNGTGVAITTGSSTVSCAGCTAGNLVILQVFVDGTSAASAGFSNVTNIKALAGTASTLTTPEDGGNYDVAPPSYTGFHQFRVGRVMANGTVSVDVAVPGSGNDTFCMIYEFSGVNASATTFFGGVSEQASAEQATAAAQTTLLHSQLDTTIADSLAVAMSGITNNVTTVSFTGETGGDFVQRATFASATGTAATICLQTADLPTAPVSIYGGGVTITSSDYHTISFTVTPLSGQTLLPDADLATGNWGVSGAATRWQALSDASDSTYMMGTAS